MIKKILVKNELIYEEGLEQRIENIKKDHFLCFEMHMGKIIYQSNTNLFCICIILKVKGMGT